MSLSIEKGQEIDYAPKASSHGSYRNSKILPLGQTSATLSATAHTEVTFELPNKCYNLSKSSLDFKMQFLESGTSSAYNRVHQSGLIMLDRVSIYDRSGVYLMDLNNTGTYSRCVTQLATPLEEMLSNDSSRGSQTAALAAITDLGFNNYPSSAETRTATPALTQGANGTRIGADGEALAPRKPMVEACYFVQGGVRNGSAQGQMNINYSIPLSELHHTICSLDKDLFFGQSLLFRCQFSPVSKLGWVSTSATDLNTNVAELDGAVSLSDIEINLAVEVSPQVVETIQNKVKTGQLNMFIPYVYSYLFNSGASTSSNVQYRFNSGHGQRLLNVYHAVANTGATSNVVYDISNQLAAAIGKVTSYQTSLDNVPLQETRIDCTDGEDYTLMRNLLSKCCIQDSNTYRHNKVHIDSWRSGACCEWDDRDHMLDGLALDNERIWAAEFTTVSAAYRHFTFAVCQRLLSISNAGVRIN